jgi:membrane protease subunit HflK
VAALWRLSRALHAGRRRVRAVLLGLAALALLASGLVVVRSGETGLRFRAGRLVDARVLPGLSWAAPGLESVARIPTGRTRLLDLTRRGGAPLELLTADENLVSVRAQVQYRVEDAAAFALAHRDAERVLRAATAAALVEEVGGTQVEALLTSGKGPLQEAVRRRAQASLEAAGTGLRLSGVSIAAVGPPPGAEDAFNSVSTAASERERRVSEAEGRTAESLALARAEADRTRRQAASARRERVEEARGASTRFRSLAREVASAREAGVSSLHREALARALSRARIVALPPRGGVEAIRTILGSAEPRPAPPAAAGGRDRSIALPPIVPEEILPKVAAPPGGVPPT